MAGGAAVAELLSRETASTLEEVAKLSEGQELEEGSRFAQAIAREGAPALDPALEMTRSPDGRRREKAYDLLGMMLEGQRARTLKHVLDDRPVAEARRAVVSGLLDAEIVCRREAARAIEAIERER
jgi:hypothetical protein